MPVQMLGSPFQAHSESGSDVVRHTTNYPQINWEHPFRTNYSPDDPEIQETEELKDEVRKELLVITTQPFLPQLKFIDVVQRLDLGYHFEKEIMEILQHVYDIYLQHGLHVEVEDINLYFVALRFRLLREQGFNVSSGKSYQ